ncbi:MAG: DUF3201 domain-containing protein [Candidatus Heimdallarchaeota archaeon]
MTDLNSFLKNNKKSIHELLNHMWHTIERISYHFEEVLPDVDIDNSHGNYIKIDKGWSESIYANPTIVFPFGEFGYSLDGLFCVFSIAPKTITEEILAKIVAISQENTAITFEIYGGDDCFQTFFHSKDESDFNTIIPAFQSTPEETIQLELTIEAVAEEAIKEALIATTLKIYHLMKEEKCLVELPNYSVE